MLRVALTEGNLRSLQADAPRRSLIRISLNLVPFAGIAFLWFIGVVREQIGVVEDRLFSTVFLGSGLLFLAMLFVGAATSTSLLGMLAGLTRTPTSGLGPQLDPGHHLGLRDADGRRVHPLREHPGLRTGALPRWVSLIGYAVALVLLFAAGEHKWIQLVFPAWVLLVSVVILFTRPQAHPSVPEKAVGPATAGTTQPARPGDEVD